MILNDISLTALHGSNVLEVHVGVSREKGDPEKAAAGECLIRGRFLFHVVKGSIFFSHHSYAFDYILKGSRITMAHQIYNRASWRLVNGTIYINVSRMVLGVRA